MEFMSQEHLDLMNERLLRLPAVREACRDLGGPKVMQFRLVTDDGINVCWRLHYADTLQLSLLEDPGADVELVGSWPRMMAAVEAGREGRSIDPGLEVRGDPALFTRLNGIFELARSAITVATDLPQV